MKRLALAVALVFGVVFLGGGTLLPPDRPGIEQMHAEMLDATVRVNAGKATGSGTVIYSKGRATYVLTNRHVIAAAGKGDTITADWFRIGDWFSETSKNVTVVAEDAALDLALLKVDNVSIRAPAVAVIGRPATLLPGETVYAVGAGLGYRPFLTQGMVSADSTDFPFGPHHVFSAPVIGGNSGGGLYRLNGGRMELVGVPSRAAVANMSIVTHIAIAIPIATVRGFLRDNGHGFIIGETEKGDSWPRYTVAAEAGR